MSALNRAHQLLFSLVVGQVLAARVEPPSQQQAMVTRQLASITVNKTFTIISEIAVVGLMLLGIVVLGLSFGRRSFREIPAVSLAY